MTRSAHLEIHKEELSFSAGHFTIFSSTEREKLHGHNYHISVAFQTQVGNQGLSFDYRHYKKKMQDLCEQLDGRFMLPSESPHMKIEHDGEHIYAHFDQQKIPFLKDDVVLLPVSNTTLEELSHWFLENILKHKTDIDQHAISGITVRVYNGPGHSSASTWGHI